MIMLMDTRVLVLFVLTFILTAVAVGLFSISRNNKRAKWMAISMLPPVLWALFIAFFLTTDSEVFALFSVTGCYIFSAWLPVTHLFMTVVFANKKMPRPVAIGVILIACIITAIVAVPDMLIEGVYSINKGIDLAPIPYVVFVVYFFLTYVSALLVVAKAFWEIRNTKRKDREQFGLLLASFVLAGFIGTICNIVLPFFNNLDFLWVGPLGLALFVPVAFQIATTKEHFSALKTFFRGFVYCMIGVLSIAGCLAALTIMAAIIGPGYALNWNHYVVGTLVLVISLIWIFVLWKFGKRIIKRVDSAGYDETEVLRSMSKIAAEKHGFSEFFSAVRHTLDKAFGVKFVDIIVFGQDTAVHVDDGNLESVLQHLATHANNKKNETIYRGDVRNESAYVALVAHDIEVITPIVGTMDSAVIGVIILSSRRRRYDRYYGETLAKVSAILSPFIQSAVYYEQIIDFNAKLKHEVRVKTKELRESNKELQKVDELKDDLLSIASHQLRTPLTGVIGYADMLHEGDFGRLKPAQLEILDRIVKSGKRMSQTLTDFLNVTRIDTGRLVLRKDPVNLSELVQDEIESLKDLATSRERELIYSHDNTDVNVIGDETNLRQVVLNLIDNAIYYGKKRIEIGLHVVDGEAIFTVRDDGIGVSKTDQAKLFTKMFRAENAKTIRPDGSGIGLYAIKNIIEDSGGEIIFESIENEGSTFGFRMRVRSEIAKNSPENA